MKKITLQLIIFTLILLLVGLVSWATVCIASPILIENLKSADIAVSQDAQGQLVKEGEKAVPELLKALTEADLYLKGQIIFILGNIKDKRAVPALEGLTQDENAYLRRNAVEALAKIKDKRVLNILASSLFDSDASVREYAARGLAELGDQRATTSLLDRLRDEREELVRVAVIDALGRLKDPDATQMLTDELNREGLSPLYEGQLLNALGQIKDKKSLPALNDYLTRVKETQSQESVLIEVSEGGVVLEDIDPALKEIEEARQELLRNAKVKAWQEKIAKIEGIIKEIQGD